MNDFWDEKYQYREEYDGIYDERVFTNKVLEKINAFKSGSNPFFIYYAVGIPCNVANQRHLIHFHLLIVYICEID